MDAALDGSFVAGRQRHTFGEVGVILKLLIGFLN